jgi:hypothetical protein
MDYINRPLALKLAGNGFFIGEVKAVSEKDITFSIITPGGHAKDKVAGESITLSRGEYGTCGHLNFEVGEKWLYDGSDISFSSSKKLEPSDLKNGVGLTEVKQNLVTRLEPGYVTPHDPAKGDLPISGTYSYSGECSPEDKALGHNNYHYNLTIGEPEPVSKKYKISIESNICKSSHTCLFSGEAPAYGYGEIVVPIRSPEGMEARNCSLLVQQLSPATEWPRLAEGQTRVRLNDDRCLALIEGCEGHTSLESPLLQKQ